MNDFTPFSDVYKFFLNSISNDYRIKKLFAQNEEIAEDMLSTWLQKGITLFKGCKQNLYDFDLTAKRFNFVLGLREKAILSELMVLEWMEWNLRNITQMNLNLNDSDYKHFSEERNLIAKEESTAIQREKVYYQISEYQNETSLQWMGGVLDV